MKIVFCLLAFVALVDTVVFAVAPVYRGVGQPIVVNAGIDAKQYIIVLNYPVLVTLSFFVLSLISVLRCILLCLLCQRGRFHG